MKIGIGLSLNPDPELAGEEAVLQAKEAVPDPGLALVFGSIELDQSKVHKGICRQLDPAVLIGGSSYAEITPAGVTKRSVAALLLSMEDARIHFAGTKTFQDPRETGYRLAEDLDQDRKKEDLSLGLLLSCYETGRENALLLALKERLGHFPVIGGMSASNYDKGMSDPEFWINYQYCGPELTTKAARLALLQLPRDRYSLAFGFGHGWEPVAPPVKVTRGSGSKVYEVDGMPVLEYYRQFLGQEGSNEFFELMVQRYAFALQYGDPQDSRWVLKLPVACDFKEGSIAYFPAEELQGRVVRLIQSSRQGLLQGARQAAERCRQALDGQSPALVLVISCCTRNSILHSLMGTELDAVREVFGREVPVFGYYSGGEFLPFLSRYEDITDPKHSLSGSHYHTNTMGLLALGTRNKVEALRRPEAPKEGAHGLNDVAQLRRLLARAEENLDSTEAFLANLSRKSYEDGEKIRKQNEIIYRYTPHEVWNQIGENVAKGDYELHDAEFTGCFLFMDVKGFTSYSEEHGSGEVVDVLNEIFAPATDLIYKHKGDVDKFIGDCIFAVFADAGDAVRTGREILGLFAGLKAKGNPFTVRIGINWGRAVRANVGSSDRREYTYIGDAVNLAQRLESNCTPGKLLLSEDIYRRAGMEFASVIEREITPKGKKNPVKAFECSLSLG